MSKSGILVLFACGVLFGCGRADESSGPPPLGELPLYPVPGCEPIDPTPCDVRTTPCQTRLLSMAACLRGEEPGDLPPVALMTEAEYAAYLNDLMAKQDPPPDPNHYERALTMLGLVAPSAFSPATVVAENVAFIWGLYRGETKDILLIDHGDAFDEQSASPVLVHEFIHLLQDRDVNLNAFNEEHATSNDSFLATDAVIEGEARLHESRYRASVLGLDPAAIDWKNRFQNTLEGDEAWIVKEPSPYTATWRVFPYEWGARYMHFTWQRDGLRGVLGRFASPPAVSQVLMASIDGATDLDFTPSTMAAPAPPVEWTALFSDRAVLGAWDTFLVLTKKTTPDTARTLALAWRGDGLWVYKGAMAATPTTALVWYVDFANEAAATAVAKLCTGVLGDAGVRQQGVRVMMAKSDGTLSLDWAFVPSPERDGGEPSSDGSPDDEGHGAADASVSGDDAPVPDDAGPPSDAASPNDADDEG